jgi:hypothetical protein
MPKFLTKEDIDDSSVITYQDSSFLSETFSLFRFYISAQASQTINNRCNNQFKINKEFFNSDIGGILEIIEVTKIPSSFRSVLY